MIELDLIYTPSRNSHLTFVNSIRFVVIQVSSVANFHVIVKLSTSRAGSVFGFVFDERFSF